MKQKKIYQLAVWRENVGFVYRSEYWFSSRVGAFEFFLNEVQQGFASYDYFKEHIDIIECTLIKQ